MSLPDSTRRLIAGLILCGLATIVVTVSEARAEGLGSLTILLSMTALLSLDWAFPLFLVRDDEAEAMNLNEAFLVASLLLLPPLGVLVAFIASTVLGCLARRRPLAKAAFNVGQQAVAVGGALGLANLLGVDAAVKPDDLLAAAAGALAYFAINSTAVSAVIALTDRQSLQRVWVEGLGIRMLVWSGGVATGLLAALAGSTEQWALMFALVPLAVLHVVSASHLRARRDRERMTGLFRTAVDTHSSMGIGEVEQAIVQSAGKFLRCRAARIASEPPGPDELGTRLRSSHDPDRWLVVSGPRGVAPFDDADQQLLDAIVAIAAPALDNASLFEAAQEERRKLAEVVASSSDGILSVGPDQRVRSWNPAMERITGFPADEVVGSRCFTVFRPRDVDGNELCVAACPGRRETIPSEPVTVQVTTITGESRWLACSYSPMPAGGYVVTARDITAERQVSELKADFLATVSHELRTPLTPIQGFLHTLLRDDVSFNEEDRRHVYEVMLRQSQRLERLVRDLLDATSLQDEKQLFLPEVVDWGAGAGRVMELFRQQEPQRQLSLHVEPALPNAVADEQRAEQVLSNLIMNAVKYSPVGSPIEVVIESRGPELVTTVVDHGPGVPSAERQRVFERFTRLGDHLTRTVGGAGLGLFIARRLVEAMGGSIGVSETPGGGASFSFTLPVYQGARQPSA